MPYVSPLSSSTPSKTLPKPRRSSSPPRFQETATGPASASAPVAVPVPRTKGQISSSSTDENQKDQEERGFDRSGGYNSAVGEKENRIVPDGVSSPSQDSDQSIETVQPQLSPSIRSTNEAGPSGTTATTKSLHQSISSTSSPSPSSSPYSSAIPPKNSRAQSTFRQMSRSADLDSPASLPSPSRGLSRNFADTTLDTPMAPTAIAETGSAMMSAGLGAGLVGGIDQMEMAATGESSSRRSSSNDSDASSSMPILSSSPEPSTSASSASVSTLADGAMTSSATSASTSDDLLDQLSERDRGLHHYREMLYAYTRGLYLEAKLSSARNEKKKEVYASFGVKQSGMERLAAKKALARRLNA